MADVSTVIAANREAVSELIAASERCSAVWTTPRAPGKWSPSQIVEHVARSIEEAANMMAGAPTKFVTLPFFLRPVARTLLFKRVLRTGGFPRARTNKAMDPQSGPATPTDARARLEGAVARFDREVRGRAHTSDTVTSGAFGTVPVVDYARFIEIHTRHHRKQMPA
jgi:DinB family protein